MCRVTKSLSTSCSVDELKMLELFIINNYNDCCENSFALSVETFSDNSSVLVFHHPTDMSAGEAYDVLEIVHKTLEDTKVF